MIGRSIFDRYRNWKRFLTLFFLIDGAVLLLAGVVLWRVDDPSIQYALRIPPPTSTFTATATPTPTTTGTPTVWPTRTSTAVMPTATSTPVVLVQPGQTVAAQSDKRATIQAGEAAALARLRAITNPQVRRRAALAGGPSYTTTAPLALAHYFAWYDAHGWNDCNISAGDRPLQPYNSDDVEAIANHIQLARSVGLNGFTLHWFAPGDRTDRNFAVLLDQSADTDFASTIVFSHHIWHGLYAPNHQKIADALRYVIDEHSQHPNFLRVENKPVIFFTDVYRTTAASSHAPQVFWANIREMVDPQRQTIWIAEGLDSSYLETFDGMYVFKVNHANAPHDYEKSSQWAQQVRAWEAHTDQAKLWVATISPGWDDLRSGCKPDVRVPNPRHRLERANGTLYEANFQAALNSNPDWLIVGSFNEWVEGTYIEPSEQYGDTYLRLTDQFIQQFQNR